MTMPCDYSKYPADWKEIRRRTLNRANNRCEQCNVRNRDWVWRGTANGKPIYQTADLNVYCAETGAHLSESGLDISMDVGENGDKLTRIVLTIAHKDHDIANNDDGNLAAWCQRCHLAHDRELHTANARATREKKMGLQSMF